MRSGSLGGSINWVLLLRGWFAVTTTIIPDAGSTFLPLHPAATRIYSVDWGLVRVTPRSDAKQRICPQPLRGTASEAWGIVSSDSQGAITLKDCRDSYNFDVIAAAIYREGPTAKREQFKRMPAQFGGRLGSTESPTIKTSPTQRR